MSDKKSKGIPVTSGDIKTIFDIISNNSENLEQNEIKGKNTPSNC
jgi:hypothetical protein